jgi:hypothetical protein
MYCASLRLPAASPARTRTLLCAENLAAQQDEYFGPEPRLEHLARDWRQNGEHALSVENPVRHKNVNMTFLCASVATWLFPLQPAS